MISSKIEFYLKKYLDKQFAEVREQLVNAERQLVNVEEQLVNTKKQFVNAKKHSDAKFANVDKQIANVDKQIANMDKSLDKIDKEIQESRHLIAIKDSHLKRVRKRLHFFASGIIGTLMLAFLTLVVFAPEILSLFR